LNVISDIKALLPQIRATVPAQLQISPLADQSIFVRSAISGVSGDTDCRMSDGIHDSHFPGQLAKHDYHRYFHTLAILSSIIALSAMGEQSTS